MLPSLYLFTSKHIPPLQTHNYYKSLTHVILPPQNSNYHHLYIQLAYPNSYSPSSLHTPTSLSPPPQFLSPKPLMTPLPLPISIQKDHILSYPNNQSPCPILISYIIYTPISTLNLQPSTLHFHFHLHSHLHLRKKSSTPHIPNPLSFSPHTHSRYISPIRPFSSSFLFSPHPPNPPTSFHLSTNPLLLS